MAEAVIQAQPATVTVTEEERVFVASQWQLMWWRFKKHRAAMIAAWVLIFLYVIAMASEFFSMAHPEDVETSIGYLRPQTIHWFDGGFHPHVKGVSGGIDPETFLRVYETDPEEKIPVHFFVRGFEYRFLGFLKTDRHLMGTPKDYDRAGPYVLGTDRLGRDMWSRLMYATRVSMSIGLVGVGISLLLGVSLGGVSGFFGGITDTVIQRMIEIVRAVPTLPLWMALAASVPRDWGPLKLYFAITIVISLFAWTDTARVVRGRFLAMREEEFVMAARLAGASTARVIFRHMVPSFASHIITVMTLAIPGMIIAETALSFLGLGLQAPAISYGVLLQAAQNLQAVALYQWLMIPAIAVTVAVLAFNFMGDGIRDAADPYSQ